MQNKNTCKSPPSWIVFGPSPSRTKPLSDQAYTCRIFFKKKIDNDLQENFVTLTLCDPYYHCISRFIIWAKKKSYIIFKKGYKRA